MIHYLMVLHLGVVVPAAQSCCLIRISRSIQLPDRPIRYSYCWPEYFAAIWAQAGSAVARLAALCSYLDFRNRRPRLLSVSVALASCDRS